jgi:hypothetical protein
MDADRDALPDDVAALKAALADERAKGLEIAAELAVARAKASEDSALIAQQKLRIAKLERQIYGQRSERSSRLIDRFGRQRDQHVFQSITLGLTRANFASRRSVAVYPGSSWNISMFDVSPGTMMTSIGPSPIAW